MRGCRMLALGVGFCLLNFVPRIASAPKFSVPPIITEGGAGVRYLWTKVQNGVLHKTLPHSFRYNQMSWSRFLNEDAKGIAEGFYESDAEQLNPLFHSVKFSGNRGEAMNKGLRAFLDFLRSGEHTMPVPERYKKDLHDLAKLLVQVFAGRRVKERNARLREIALRSQTVAQAASEKQFEAAEEEEQRLMDARDAERREWGKMLSLAPESGPSSGT